jgi:hypothetical protein
VTACACALSTCSQRMSVMWARVPVSTRVAVPLLPFQPPPFRQKEQESENKVQSVRSITPCKVSQKHGRGAPGKATQRSLQELAPGTDAHGPCFHKPRGPPAQLPGAPAPSRRLRMHPVFCNIRKRRKNNPGCFYYHRGSCDANKGLRRGVSRVHTHGTFLLCVFRLCTRVSGTIVMALELLLWSIFSVERGVVGEMGATTCYYPRASPARFPCFPMGSV